MDQRRVVIAEGRKGGGIGKSVEDGHRLARPAAPETYPCFDQGHQQRVDAADFHVIKPSFRAGEVIAANLVQRQHQFGERVGRVVLLDTARQRHGFFHVALTGAEDHGPAHEFGIARSRSSAAR